MNFKYFLYLLLCLMFASCGEDRRKEYAEQTDSDRWIYNTLLDKYYWYKDVPSSKGLNFFTEPQKFFQALLSKEDGKNNYHYSYLTVETEGTTRANILEDSYGFDFTLYKTSPNDTTYTACVLYVLPDSPAAEIELKRGDWICKVADNDITQNNYKNLLSGESKKLHIGAYDTERDTVVIQRIATIGDSRPVEDTPILHAATYETTQGNVAYMVYNHFTPSYIGNDEKYDKQLLALSNKFKSENVTNFILDLRYNPGGAVSSAHLLSTILAPQTAMNKPLGYMEFNDKFATPQIDLILNTDSIAGGANLNLSTLYILTTSATASASELVAYCLSSYMNVVVIGSTTEGKNVGSSTYTYSGGGVSMSMHPIVCKIYNSEGESNYASGIPPSQGLSVNELEYPAYILPFGNQNEILLNIALSTILNEKPLTRALTPSTTFSPVHSLPNKKSFPAVIIDFPID